MNSQDILRNLGISLDVRLDNSETYDYEIAGFDNDYDVNLLNFTNPISFDTSIIKDLSNDEFSRNTIKLCEIDNRPNDPTYIYSGITYVFDFQDFAEHFNIVDVSGNTIHDYENFILNNDVYTYTGFTGEVHYFYACEINPQPTPTPVPTNTPTPTPTDTPVPTSTETPIPTSTSTPEPTPTDTPVPTSTQTPTPTESSTPIPTSTETPTPTSTQVVNSITLAYNYSLGMGALSFSGMTTTELGDVTCRSLSANYQTQFYYDTLGLGTQFVNDNNQDSNQYWVTNQYYGTNQGPLWVVGSTEYIIETDFNGVVVRYEPFVVQCSPTPTPTDTPSPTGTETPTPTPSSVPTIPFYQFTNTSTAANDGDVAVQSNAASWFHSSLSWGDIVRWKFNRYGVLGPGPEGTYSRTPYNAGTTDNWFVFTGMGAGSRIYLTGLNYDPSGPSGGILDATGKSIVIELTTTPSYDVASGVMIVENFTIVSSSGSGFNESEVYQVNLYSVPPPTPTPTESTTPTPTPTDTSLPTTGLVMDFDASTSNSFIQSPTISDGDTIVEWDNTVSGQPNFGGAGTILNPPTWDSSSSDFNNLGAINFVPNQSLIAQGITGLTSTNAYTMFIVVSTTSTSAQWILQGLKSTNSADDSLTILFTNGNFQVTTTTNYNRFIPYTTNTPTLYTVVYDGTQTGADMMVIRENGVFKNSGTISLPSNLNSTLTGIELGTNAGESVGLYGQIPAFKMYNTVLTNSEITAVENSLMTKFNL